MLTGTADLTVFPSICLFGGSTRDLLFSQTFCCGLGIKIRLLSGWLLQGIHWC